MEPKSSPSSSPSPGNRPASSTPLRPAEQPVFKASPSQVLNWSTYLFCALGVIALLTLTFTVWAGCALLLPVPIGIATWFALELKARVYELTSERIRLSRGLLSRRTDEMELYRVKDITVVEPLFLRMLGLGNLLITTTDTTTPLVTVPAIRGVHQLREDLRRHVEICRDRKRVRLSELDEPLSS